ncbi:MAG: hypothetical protein ISS28_07805, partial [Candidatus Cloacimonetes bacterium]|nr:hypothetical protein [Candidatus Cloacimonadota bacterium]
MLNKKKTLGTIAMMFIIAIYCGLSADTIIDSVYSTPELDGYIFFSQQYQSLSVNNWMIHMGAGDTGTDPIANDPNSRGRSYVSFEMPEIPEGYALDSVYIRLYQYSCYGNSVHGQYPDWNVPGGDTMFCIMDHIDYGNELDVSDWTKGDPGDPGTIHTNIGIISDRAEYGYRYFDITPYVWDDYENDRDKTQYRIRFPIETDWDFLSDNVIFKTTTTTYVYQHPIIFLYFSSTNSVEKDINEISYNVKSYPNPFNTSTTISFNTCSRYREDIFVEVYNVKGQRITTLLTSRYGTGNRTEVLWDGRNMDGNVVSYGLYLIKISARGGSSFGGEDNEVNVIKKV